jgi:RNA polymerase sigma-70 factor (ECF subfamily)
VSRDEVNDRLSQLATDWGVLREAHGEAAAARAAQEVLIQRYGPAVRRYLKRVAGSGEAADELFQEFGLAVVEGKLKTADPDRGRFRDYVKAVLRHLVSKYHAKRKKGPQASGGESPALGAVPAPEPPDDRLDEAWRDNLLARTWAALAAANRPAYEVLRFRADHPDLSSQELAEQLSARTGKAQTAEAVRQTIHRARKQFGLLLVDEVGQSLSNPTADAVAEELGELKLLEYCRGVLEG